MAWDGRGALPRDVPPDGVASHLQAKATRAPLPDPCFWSGRRVLLTGHTGFKGGWTALWLHRLGAHVTGLALDAEEPSLHALARVGDHVAADLRLDIRDQDAVTRAVRQAAPDIVLHLAAQPLVRRSLVQPVETFATNVMGTLHLLHALRDGPPPRAVLVVTTDKVYAPPDGGIIGHAHAETDRLGGEDPYAASKAACEMAVAAMARNFLVPAGIPVGVARAGNVIGGGDFAADRLIPDIVRATRAGQVPVIRHPGATRPWQHVLDCVCGYLLHTQALAGSAGGSARPACGGPQPVPGAPATLNFGPADGASVTVGSIAAATLRAFGQDGEWAQGPHDARETHALALDSTLARRSLGWRERLTGQTMIDMTTAWYRAWADGADMHDFTLAQIAAYEALP